MFRLFVFAVAPAGCSDLVAKLAKSYGMWEKTLPLVLATFSTGKPQSGRVLCQSQLPGLASVRRTFKSVAANYFDGLGGPSYPNRWTWQSTTSRMAGKAGKRGIRE